MQNKIDLKYWTFHCNWLLNNADVGVRWSTSKWKTNQVQKFKLQKSIYLMCRVDSKRKKGNECTLYSRHEICHCINISQTLWKSLPLSICRMCDMINIDRSRFFFPFVLFCMCNYSRCGMKESLTGNFLMRALKRLRSFIDCGKFEDAKTCQKLNENFMRWWRWNWNGNWMRKFWEKLLWGILEKPNLRASVVSIYRIPIVAFTQNPTAWKRKPSCFLRIWTNEKCILLEFSFKLKHKCCKWVLHDRIIHYIFSKSNWKFFQNSFQNFQDDFLIKKS